jgi:hypothetical protein
MGAREVWTRAAGSRLIIDLMSVAILSPLKLRIELQWRNRALIRSLASGADPGGSDLLAMRARALTARRERCRIAGGLENVVAAADDQNVHWTAAAPVDGAAVLGARAELLELAERLRSNAPVTPRGVALAELLLIDYDSPVLDRGSTSPLRDAARAAAAAL